MAATARSQKGPSLKKPQDQMSNSNSSAPPRRNAWGSPNRASISPIPPYTPNGRSSNGFPPLHANGKSGSNEEREKLLANLAGNIGSIITVTLRSTVRYEGTLTSVTPSPAEEASLILKDAKDVSVPGAPIKETLTIHAANVASFVPGSGNATPKPNDNFRTDTEISRANPQKRERELQAWQPELVTEAPNGVTPVPLAVPNSTNNLAAFQRSDDLTFGPSAGGTWDQFAANERLFGVTTQFDEDLYTTKLDRSAKDFKERERRAEKIAQEITNSTASNPHVVEERSMNLVDDSGTNEEDKYSTVVRGTNAYIPPAARKAAGQGAVALPTTLPPVKEVEKAEVPKVSVNAPDGTEKTMPKSTSPPAGGAPAKAPADALPAFRDFVTNEKQRLTQKKQALVKNEMDKRMADLVKFSQSFKLNKPIPEDLVSILAKDEDKQRQIREKSSKDATSSGARVIGVVSTVSAVSPVSGKAPMPVSKLVEARKAAAASSGATTTTATKTTTPASKSTTMDTPMAPNGTAKITSSTSTPKVTMVIQSIPPFKGRKISGDSKLPTSTSQPLSPTSAQRLNVNATSFKPNLKTVNFAPQNGPTTTQAQAGSSATSSPKVTKATPPMQPNPFFGTQIVKKSPPVNIKDDFNPFKYSKVPEASVVSAFWPYNGKKYMQIFPAPAPPAQPSPLVPPHAPPPPPANYDEEAAAQAARGYTAVYAYPAYAYPGQPPHMVTGMPGMPPGAFMHSPYMQPMHYPPTMPPPGGQHMYAPPPMGQMPPHQSYMPPPPGAYPPPNGAAPRPSMPPTPIPAHAHAYYHQSPQLQHAVPYPMMIPPPAPNGPPHPYESGPPPVQMGGVGHA